MQILLHRVVFEGQNLKDEFFDLRNLNAMKTVVSQSARDQEQAFNFQRQNEDITLVDSRVQRLIVIIVASQRSSDISWLIMVSLEVNYMSSLLNYYLNLENLEELGQIYKSLKNRSYKTDLKISQTWDSLQIKNTFNERETRSP